MRYVFVLALLLLAVPASATEGSTPAELGVRPAVTQPAAELDAPSQPKLVLKEMRVPERRAATDAEALDQDMPSRGSFWWLVGVIVIAGIILAVLLD